MRLLRVVIVALLVAMTLPSGRLLGATGAESVEDAVEDVDRAEQTVGQAEHDRARLQRTIADLAGTRTELLDQLLATLAQYEQRNGELEDVSYTVSNLRSRLLLTEREVGDLRSAVQNRAILAYMRGSMRTNTVLWSAGSFQEAAMMLEVVQRTTERDVNVLGTLASTRRLLTSLRAEYEDERRRLLTIRDDLGSLADDLEEQFRAADGSLAQAYTELNEADARYRAALTDLEAAQRKLATFRGAGQWRPIVERYFPADLVEDALWVMQCESRGNPDATNPVSGAAGLYQFLSGTWAYASAAAGFAGASRYDPEAQIAAAAWLVQQSIRVGHPRGPWGHWSCRP